MKSFKLQFEATGDVDHWQKHPIDNPKTLTIFQGLVRAVVRRKTLFSSNFYDIQASTSKPKRFRTTDDIINLKQAFQNIKFFTELTQQIGEKLAEEIYYELNYEYHPKNSVIFNIGEMGKKFYIILRGTVIVLARKSGLEQEEGASIEFDTEDEGKIRQKGLSFMTNIKIQHQRRQVSDEESLLSRFEGLSKVSTLGSGNYFGEIALTKNVARTATIVCAEDTHFITLSREAFNQFLSNYYTQKTSEEIVFLRNVVFFRDWPEGLLSQLYYHFSSINFKYHDIVYKQGQVADQIYVVKQGEIELSRITYSEPAKLIDPQVKSLMVSNRFRKSKRTKVALISAKQIFGQEEVFKECRRGTTATCISENASLLILGKDQFFNYCKQKNTITKIQESTNIQEQWRASKELKLNKQIELNDKSQQNLEQSYLTPLNSGRKMQRPRISSSDGKTTHNPRAAKFSHLIRAPTYNLGQLLNTQLEANRPPSSHRYARNHVDQVSRFEGTTGSQQGTRRQSKSVMSSPMWFYDSKEDFRGGQQVDIVKRDPSDKLELSIIKMLALPSESDLELQQL